MNRICVVTGGTRGIGRAIAAALLERGDSVMVTGRTMEGASAAERALAAACGDSARVASAVCDVRDHRAVEAAMATAVSRFGGIDVLINNAGFGVGTRVADLSYDEWDRIIGVNLTGVFHGCRAAIPHLRARGGGWIVNISSLSTSGPFPGGAAYAAAKAGVNAFTETLMQELRYDGIRVTCVLPGSVATEFSGRSARDGADWRLQPEDVALAVVNLLDADPRALPSRLEIRPSQPRKG